MSNRRSILVLIFICAALALAEFLLRHGAVGGTAASELAPFLGSDLEVSTIRIERRGEPAAVIERMPEWRLTEPYSASVDEPVVLRMLDALAFTRPTESLSEVELLRLGRTSADFALENPVVRVTVAGGFGSKTLSIGKPTPAADGVYAAVDGDASVLVVPMNMLVAVDLPPDSLRRRSLFLGGSEAVSSFDIKRGAGSMLSFARSGDIWKMDGAVAAPQKVAKFLSDLAAANAARFVWPVGASNEDVRASAALLAGYGLDPDSAITVTLKDAGGAGRQVSFGKAADGASVYALVQNGGAIVTVPATLKDAAAQDAMMCTDSRLFPVEARSVAFVALTDGDTVYALARGDGGRWSLESPIAAAADPAVVDAMLTRILSLSPADADAAGVGVALSTNSAVIRVSRRSVLAGGFEQLRSREMLRVDPKEVRRIVRTRGGAGARPTAVIYSRDRRAWNVESTAGASSTVSVSGIETVLASINPLMAERVEKLKVPASDLDAYGLGAPHLTIAVDQEREDAVRRNILIGGKTSGGHFATIGSSDAVFVVSDAVVDALSAPLVED